MPPRDDSPYVTLGIPSNSDETEIKKAYRKLALKWHPDKHDDTSKEEAEVKFKKIAQAYEILSDSKKRADFDRSENPAAFRRRSAPHHRHHHPDMFRSPFDIFREFFGHRDPFEGIFFDDAFSFPDIGSYAHKKPSNRRFSSPRVHIFYDEKRPRDDNCQFSTVIRFSSPTEPGKNASVQKMSTTTKLVDGKKIVTKTVENDSEHIIEVHEDGELKSRTVTTPPTSPTDVTAPSIVIKGSMMSSPIVA
ncbi:unnamed protein product [Caenorhabditis auriculariae]|uniref:J domain-containing protein n=1 Tax=Caenorhabditis auriculariae TaxID=2777116 RepID=A0A8S1HUZ7_9PELO|nr:unnamed protein product [Caenorhabditis auriculariae]